MSHLTWKKIVQKALKLTMTAAVIVVPFSSGLQFSAEEKSGKDYDKYTNPKTMLFETSFENDPKLLESTLDATKSSANITGNVVEKKVDILGNVIKHLDKTSIEGSSDFNSSEAKTSLFDGDLNTKFLTSQNVPSSDKPVWVSFRLNESVKIDRYHIASANDAQERDPLSWKLSAKDSTDAWVVLDEQVGQQFSKRLEVKEYLIENEASYSEYKLEVTANRGESGMTQFSEFAMGTGIKDEEEPEEEKEFMVTRNSAGPKGMWNQSSGGWSGSNALEIMGSHVGNDRAYSYNTLFKDVTIPVTDETKLSYTIFPKMLEEANYDYDYTQMYIAMDAKFDDGTYLSDLSPTDRYGTLLTPQAQGDSKILTTNQWNLVTSEIGKVASGKTITELLVGYDNSNNPKSTNADFMTYIDDLNVYNQAPEKIENYADYVNILRGTNDSPGFSRGLAAPAVTMPHGFNFWVPATTSGDNNNNNYQDKNLYHMTISHEPSYWVGDRGTWQYMASSTQDAASNPSISANNRRSAYDSESEIAKAHYYSVTFKEGTPAAGVQMETTPTMHGAISRFTYPQDATSRSIILDSVKGGDSIKFDDATNSFTAKSTHTGNGMKDMYVYGEFSAPIKASNNGRPAIATFDEDVVEMKMATSFISHEQAKTNMELEIKTTDDFDSIYTKAQGAWNEKLSVIEVEGASSNDLTTLYSNMYRLFMYPNLLSENTGTESAPIWQYASPYKSGADMVQDGTLYYNNGFWDTYRTTWAAYGLLTPESNTEMLNGLVQHYNDQGWVPRWIAPGGTNSMVGTSSDVIFGDAIAKDFDFDRQGAYESALRNATAVSQNLTNGGRAQLESSIFRGYTSASQGEGFSWSMEGYINDYGIYQLANELGYKDEAAYFLNRSLNYAHLFDEADGEAVEDMWFRGKNDNGSWTNEGSFDPLFWGGDYTETNAYNMAVSVTQDGQGLANLYGGRDELAKKLDTIFTTNGDYSGYGASGSVGGIHEQKEAREIKLGQYGHSNQPSHHIPYMYNYAGQPWKTQMYVRDVLKRSYVGSDFGQGYIGDEDNGEMSAWYIFSTLGFYPVSMGNDEYAIGSPLFDKATVHLEGGNDLVIVANNNSDENVYIQSMEVNGAPHTASYLKHGDIANGGTITFNMGNTPNEAWGSAKEDLPTSITKDDEKPNPQIDLVDSGVKEVETLSEGQPAIDEMSTTLKNAKNIVDNTTNTTATYKDEAEINYSFSVPRQIEMLTLTTKVANEGPEGFVLSGSNDGENWVELSKRENIVFDWDNSTKPFIFDNADTYQRYKVELKGGKQLAELELFGDNNPHAGIDRDALGALIVHAEEVVASSEIPEVMKPMLIEEIEKAKIVYEKQDATEKEIVDAYLSLKETIETTKNYRRGFEKIEAETFDSAHSAIVNDGTNIGGVKDGTWVGYNNVFFDKQPGKLDIHYAAQQKDAGGYIEMRLDSRTSEPIAKIDTPVTGNDWNNYVTVSTDFEALDDLKGLHTVYFTFVSSEGQAYVANVDYFQFYPEEDTDPEVPTVTSVDVNPVEVEIVVGRTQQFTATVTGEHEPAQTVTWAIEDATSTETKITDEGLLTVGIDETAVELHVIATSTVDASVSGSAKVTVSQDVPIVTEVKVTTNVTEFVKGQSLQFEAEVIGEHQPLESVTWSVEGATSDKTAIDATGVLVIALDETATTLTVKATSEEDNTVVGEFVLTVEDEAATVTEVKVTSTFTELEQGASGQFEAEVVGENQPSQFTTWSIAGAKHLDTKIDATGLLTIALEETAETIDVTATSSVDTTKAGTKTITVKMKDVPTPDPEPSIDDFEFVLGNFELTKKEIINGVKDGNLEAVILKKSGAKVRNKETGEEYTTNINADIPADLGQLKKETHKVRFTFDVKTTTRANSVLEKTVTLTISDFSKTDPTDPVKPVKPVDPTKPLPATGENINELLTLGGGLLLFGLYAIKRTRK